MATRASACSFGTALLLLLSLAGISLAQLSTGFYSSSCPNVSDTVKSVMQSAIAKEQRMGASILRLSFHESFSDAKKNILAPSSDLSNLTSFFAAQGLSQKDMVALSGAHTIGQARCTTFRDHIYNEANIDSAFASTVQSGCPSTIGTGDNNLRPLDLQSPTVFDNNYYKNLVRKQGLLHSDQSSSLVEPPTHRSNHITVAKAHFSQIL